VASLVDTNILVYRFDPRFPKNNGLRLSFYAAASRRKRAAFPIKRSWSLWLWSLVCSGGRPLLSLSDARREAEEFLTQFTVLYPNALLFRTALRGAAAYQLSWFDAHLWD